MKCWECRKQVEQASSTHYVHMNRYSNEPIKVDTRLVCKECYPKLKFDGTRHIRCFSPRGRQLKG